MTYKEFLEKCKTLVAGSGGYYVDTKPDPSDYSWHNRKQIPCEPYVYVEWSVSYVGGGSCWHTGNEDPHYTESTGNPPEELTFLDDLLEEVKPGVSFLQYRNLTNKLIEHDTRTESEYYGNSTTYAQKIIKLKPLYDYLQEKNWI
jgi:hypothetical protein